MIQSQLTIQRTIRKTSVSDVKELTSHPSNCTSWNRRLAVIDIRTWARGKKLLCGRIWRRLALGWVINLDIIFYWWIMHAKKYAHSRTNDAVERFLGGKTFQDNWQKKVFSGLYLHKMFKLFKLEETRTKLFTQKTHQNLIKVKFASLMWGFAS